MSEAKFMTTQYNKPIQNMNTEEAEAYSDGQNTGIKTGLSFLPIGRAITAIGGVISKAPLIANAFKAFRAAPSQYAGMFATGTKVADKTVKIAEKGKKVNAIVSLKNEIPQTP